MNWKLFVEKKNAKTFVLPSGWDSRETIANQLECSPDKVDDHLRPALKTGEVIKQQFRVWEPSQKRIVMVTAYRDATKDKAAPEADDLQKIREMKAAGKSWAEIATALGRSEGSVRNTYRRAQ